MLPCWMNPSVLWIHLLITHDIDEAILISDRIYLSAGRPGHIAKEIIIKEPKPRGKDFTMIEEFLNYKKQILEQLHL